MLRVDERQGPRSWGAGGKAGNGVRRHQGTRAGPRSVLSSWPVLQPRLPNAPGLWCSLVSPPASSLALLGPNSQFSGHSCRDLVVSQSFSPRAVQGAARLHKPSGAPALAGIPQAASTQITSKTVPRLRVHDRSEARSGGLGLESQPPSGVCHEILGFVGLRPPWPLNREQSSL